jgi:phage baseplate assembly protein W
MTNAGQVAVAFPLIVGPDGYAVTTASRQTAAEQLIEELLFTDAGERLNQPALGCGLIDLVFDSLTDELKAATQFQVSSRLQAWLADVIQVVSVVVEAAAPELEITVVYQLLPAGGVQTAVFRR